jgi:type II secretory pathway component PulL
MSRTILGIDIRQNAASAVLIKSGIKSSSVEAHFYFPLEPAESEAQRLLPLMEKVAGTVDLKQVSCLMALPAALFSYRNISVPFKDQKKIRQILPFELEPLLAQPAEELVSDYYTIWSDESTNILTASMEKKLLSEYLEVLSRFHLDPLMVTAGAFATAVHLAADSQDTEDLIIVDSDDTNHTLYIVAQGRIATVRPFSKGKTPQADVQALSLNIQRTVTGIDPLLKSPFEPQRVLLTGHGIDTPAAEQKLRSLLKLPVERTDLSTGPTAIKPETSDASFNPFLMQNASALAAVELAGKACLNFHGSAFGIRRHLIEHKPSLVTAAILGAVVLLLFMIGAIFDSYSTQKELTLYNDRITEIFKSAAPDIDRIVNPVQQMKERLDEIKKEFSDSAKTESTLRTIDILYHVNNSIPKEIDVQITRFGIGDDGIQISGDTKSFNAVNDMKGRLEQNKIFKAVTITSANMEQSGDRVRFKLKIDL